MNINVKDYRYKWAKALARKIDDAVTDKTDELNENEISFEKLLIENILEYTYQTSN